MGRFKTEQNRQNIEKKQYLHDINLKFANYNLLEIVIITIYIYQIIKYNKVVWI